MIDYDNLIGKRFGKLTVVEYSHSVILYKPNGKIRKTKRYYNCKCDCGKKIVICAYNLTIKNFTKSCGCEVIKKCKENFTKHGLRDSRLFHIWAGIRARCFRETEPAYRKYGARGITVCYEWNKDFMSFYNWAMANGYRDDLSIDRIDNDGNYCPENCRWANAEQQANNRSTCIYIYGDGDKKTLKQYCSDHGLKYKLVWERMKRYNKTFEQAIVGAKTQRGKS